MFKVGDKVKIARVITHRNWGDWWADSMTNRVGDGEVYTITRIFGVRARLNNAAYPVHFNWPLECFDPAEPGLFD